MALSLSGEWRLGRHILLTDEATLPICYRRKKEKFQTSGKPSGPYSAGRIRLRSWSAPPVGFLCVTKVAKGLIERNNRQWELKIMLSWAIAFLVIALIAAVLGFGGIAGAAAGIAKILFFVFLAIFVISLLAGLARRGP